MTQQLLFAPGDELIVQRLAETERQLRKAAHLYDADIRVVSRCDDEVDIEVITRDIWSLKLDASVSRTGGESAHHFGIAETNAAARTIPEGAKVNLAAL